MGRRKRRSVRTPEEVFRAEVEANRGLIARAEKWTNYELVMRRVRYNLWEVGTIEDDLRLAQAKTLSAALFAFIETKRLMKFLQDIKN